MANEKDKNYGKGDKPESERPIQKPKVQVEAPPQDGRNPKHKQVSERVKKDVKEKVDEAIEKSKGGGFRKQLDAAKEAVKEKAAEVSPGSIRKIKVRIQGDVEGPDGKKLGVDERVEADPKG